MSENKTVDILKKAIVLEHRGKALYQSVAPETDAWGVKELFVMLAEEEENHINILTRQLKSVVKGGGFDAAGLADTEDAAASKILTEKIAAGISGAGYEAAVIAAALEFEKNAVEFYSKQAESAQSKDEKKLFKWLADWEKGHMTMLAQIDRQLMEDIWYDNNFWPLD